MADFIQAASGNSPLLFLTDVLTQLKLFKLRGGGGERQDETIYIHLSMQREAIFLGNNKVNVWVWGSNQNYMTNY